MNILPGLLNQRCIYWPPSETPDRYGKYTPQTPVELPCQQESTIKSINTSDGKTVAITATLFLSQEVSKEGWLMLGSLDEAPTFPVEDYRIKHVMTFQDIDNDEKLWKAFV
jgi:hypothetical protein